MNQLNKALYCLSFKTESDRSKLFDSNFCQFPYSPVSYEDRTLLALNISSAVHKSDKAQKTTSGVSLVVWPGPLLSVRQYGTLFLNLSNALNKNHKTQPVRYSVIRWLLHPNLSDQLEARHCIQCSRTQTHNRMVDKCHYEKLRAPLLGFKSKPLHKICYKYKIYIIFGAWHRSSLKKKSWPREPMQIHSWI